MLHNGIVCSVGAIVERVGSCHRVDQEEFTWRQIVVGVSWVYIEDSATTRVLVGEPLSSPMIQEPKGEVAALQQGYCMEW